MGKFVDGEISHHLGRTELKDSRVACRAVGGHHATGRTTGLMVGWQCSAEGTHEGVWFPHPSKFSKISCFNTLSLPISTTLIRS